MFRQTPEHKKRGVAQYGREAIFFFIPGSSAVGFDVIVQYGKFLPANKVMLFIVTVRLIHSPGTSLPNLTLIIPKLTREHLVCVHKKSNPHKTRYWLLNIMLWRMAEEALADCPKNEKKKKRTKSNTRHSQPTRPPRLLYGCCYPTLAYRQHCFHLHRSYATLTDFCALLALFFFFIRIIVIMEPVTRSAICFTPPAPALRLAAHFRHFLYYFRGLCDHSVRFFSCLTKSAIQ